VVELVAEVPDLAGKAIQQDKVSCGSGDDTARVDANDTVNANCETVTVG
jgi:hypothetical protein